MGFYFVDPETYEKYKADVLAMSHAVQINFQEQLPADKRRPGFRTSKSLRNSASRKR